jgi:multiple sugar transport system substrate-binding protein
MTKNGLSDLTSLELSRRGLLGLGAAVGVGAAVSACGGGSADSPGAAGGGEIAEGPYEGPKVDLAFWNGFTGGDGPFMKGMVEKFNSENENINVKMNTLEWGDFYSKMPNAVASGAGPDVAAMHVDQVGTNAARGVIQPLDNMVAALELEEGDFSETVWKAGVYDDKRYAIPLDVHPLGFYYNKTLLEQGGISEPPQDRESWEAALKGMKDAGVSSPLGHRHLAGPPHLHQPAEAVRRVALRRGGRQGHLQLRGRRRGADLVRQPRPRVQPAERRQRRAGAGLRQGRDAMTWDGIWMRTVGQGRGPRVGCRTGPADRQRAGVWASSHQLTVMRQAKPDDNKLHASRQFLAYLSENSQTWAESGQIPARNSVRESGDFEALEVQNTLARSSTTSSSRPPCRASAT